MRRPYGWPSIEFVDALSLSRMMSFGRLGGSRGEDVLRRHGKEYRNKQLPQRKMVTRDYGKGAYAEKSVRDDLPKSGDM